MKKILYITINKTEDKEMLITRKNKSSIVKISEEKSQGVKIISMKVYIR